eukprot:6315560-Amphidinium_carterae.1
MLLRPRTLHLCRHGDVQGPSGLGALQGGKCGQAKEATCNLWCNPRLKTCALPLAENMIAN